MALTRLTAEIIKSRGDDISVDVAASTEFPGKYIGWIVLQDGTEGGFVPLLSTNPEFESMFAAKEAMQKLIEQIRSADFFEEDKP